MATTSNDTNWRDQVKAPEKDTRIQTAVSLFYNRKYSQYF